MGREPVRNRITAAFRKWREDYVHKTVLSALFSLSVTVLFALYNGFLGIRLCSVWHGSICAFYLLLVCIRGILLSAERRSRGCADLERTRIHYRACRLGAILLLLLNLALTGPIALMVRFEKPVRMGMIPAIAMAAYTTYKVTMASIHIRRQKHRNHKNLLVTELRTINLIDALVSVLTLQNTLIMVNNAESDPADMRILTIVSSAAIHIVILFITIRLLTGLSRRRGESGPSGPT